MTRFVDGVVVVDKPGGCTSHDVVQRVRKALDTRSVGHAGTLDPMATGVLVVAVGEATKLVAHLSAAAKEYEAEVTLGVATNTLDADGRVLAEAPLPAALSAETVREAARRFVGQIHQRAPEVSAIKVGGRPLHARVRRGEHVEAPVRQVEVRALEVLAVDLPRVRLRVACGKGFYVRSLARDLAEALGTRGHLSALRRTRSGEFGLDRAVPYEVVARAAEGDPEARMGLVGSMCSIEQAGAGLFQVRLSEAGERDARHGRPIAPEGVEGGSLPEVDEQATLALLGAAGRLVALGRRQGPVLRVVRGIRQWNARDI